MHFLTHFLANIRWQDALDILLNSYVFFRFYILFRGTNVLRVLFGLACIWFAQKLAVSLGLIVSSWISQEITAAAALIVVVIFRNEIRSVLQTKNIRGILWELPKRSTTTPIETLAESAFKMAHERIGALIVVPGRDDLEEIVHHGLGWQGTISNEMIMSVFWPDNPVHDGAAVVRDDRIEEVGCILPLSVRKDLPSNYGTRHRAALGLAEDSDALVIVVSEESGAVAIAKDGRITRIQDRGTLEKHLRDHAGQRLGSRSDLMNEKIELGLAVFLSAAFTLGIWFSITRGFDTLASFEVPVEYRNRDSVLQIVNTSANTVRLQLSGSRSLLDTVNPNQLRVRVDLGKAATGSNSYTITNEDITLPPGVILKDVQPPMIDVDLDMTSQKELPVQADFVGKLSKDRILAEVRLEPAVVTVIGASGFLDKLSTIYTEKIPVADLADSGVIEVGLTINPVKLKLAPGEKSTVTVYYSIRKKTTLK
jgi:diadenylate cyclase